MAELLGWEPMKPTKLSIENKLLSIKDPLKCSTVTENQLRMAELLGWALKVFWAIHMVGDADVQQIKADTIQYNTVTHTV